MATYRVQMSFPMDTALPKDAITVNPHFNGSDAQGLANALHTNLVAWTPTAAAPFTLKVYDAATPPPSYPLATVTQPGTPPASGIPREIALCLSYYTTYNRPRYRGRLFLPGHWITNIPQLRPLDSEMAKVLQFGTNVLQTGMPAQTNWVVWSTIEKKSMGGVNNIWCDDEWDTIRSRGLGPSKRTVGTI